MPLDKSMSNTIIALWCTVIGYLVLIYIPVLYHIALSSDMSILVSFAGRMLDGYSFTNGYYETNPPFNIMIYVPVVWISRISGLPVYDVHFYYSLFWLVLSVILTGLMLRKNTLLEDHWKHLLLMCFVFTAFMSASNNFGDRDHLVFLGLVPFMLVQLDMMPGHKNLPLWLRLPALIFGATMVMLKPHYGILPTILLLVRIWKERSFRFLLAGDFLSLSIAVLSYATVLYFYFPDFVTSVLMDTIKLYATNPHPMVKFEVLAYGLMIMICVIAIYELKLPPKQRQLCLFLCACTVVLLIPYAVQGKGLNYHRIGYISFFYTSVAFISYFATEKYLPKIFKPHIAPGIVIAVLFILCTTFYGIPRHTVTDSQFRQMPISKKLDEYCQKPCSFLMLYDYSDIIHQIEIYHDAFHASRFTSLWFLPVIIRSEDQIEKGEVPDLTPEEIRHYKNKYLSMVGADMVNFKPDVILDFKDYEVWGNKKFDFIAYLSQDPVFAKEMEHYQKVDSFTFARKIYYKGYTTPFDKEEPVTFDIYKRVD